MSKKIYNKKSNKKSNKEKNKKFSVIIPMYNSSTHINKCLNSVLNQTYTNLEIIIVDDGSTDTSYQICQDVQKKDSRIKLIKQENSGVSAARNKGVENATGKYITFVDADDCLKKDAIEVLNKVISRKNNNIDLVIGEISKIINGKEIKTQCVMKNKYTTERLFNELYNNISYIERINSVCAKAYDLDNITKNNIIFDENITIGEDLLFNINYLMHCKNIQWIENVIYNYNVNNTSCTNKFIKNKYNELKKVNEQFKSLLSAFENKKLLNLASYINVKNIYSCVISLFHKDCSYSIKEKINYIKIIKSKEAKHVIKNMGIKFFILSILFYYLPSAVILLICKVINKIKNKIKNKSNKPVYIRAYLRKNLGDDLFVKIISERYSNTQFDILSNYNYKNIFGPNVRSYGGLIYNFINKSIQVLTLKRYSLIKLFIRFRKVIVWIGGSIFMENSNSDKYTLSMPKDKDYYILGSNFGPYKTDKYFKEAVKTFKNAKDVCFRESYSYNQFRNETNNVNDNVRMAPDLVFNLNTDNIKIEENSDKNKKVVISVINCKNRFSKKIQKYYKNNIISICKYFINKGYEIVLMSYCKLEGDEKAIRDILNNKNFKDKMYIDKISTYFYKGNIQEALNVMANCQIVVATRFHSLILAILFEKIVIPIVYSKKTLNFLEDINFKGKYIDLQNTNLEKGDIEQTEKENVDIEEIYLKNKECKIDKKPLVEKSKRHFEKLDTIF